MSAAPPASSMEAVTATMRRPSSRNCVRSSMRQSSSTIATASRYQQRLPAETSPTRCRTSPDPRRDVHWEVDVRYKIALRQSEEGYSVSVPGLPGCWSQGATEDEAIANIQDAIREYLVARDQLLDGATIREVEVS